MSRRFSEMFAVLLISLTSIAAQAQSFDCRTNTKPDEVAICQSSRLSELDQRMSNLYFNRLSNLAGLERRSLVASQVQWLQSRNICRQDIRCIQELYERRISELSAPTGLTSPIGQSSSALVRANPGAHYEIFKSMIADIYKIPGRPNPNKKYYIFGDICTENWKTIRSYTPDELTNALSSLAERVEKASRQLTWMGYPQSIWQSLLANYERAEFSKILRGGIEEGPEIKILLEAMDDFRRKSNAALPEVDYTWGCGGPGVLLKIKTVPSGGQVWVIPKFFHTLCSKQHLDADDPDQCNHGQDYSDGADTGLIGTYRYVVTWPGGLRKKGTQTFGDGVYNQSAPIIWTIRYSGQ